MMLHWANVTLIGSPSHPFWAADRGMNGSDRPMYPMRSYEPNSGSAATAPRSRLLRGVARVWFCSRAGCRLCSKRRINHCPGTVFM